MPKIRDPLEANEQQALFAWAELQACKYRDLSLMYHIPNGGRRDVKEAAMLKAEGVKAGVPDIFLPVARGGYHGLYIELKRKHGGRTSAVQEEWIDKLRAQGYAVYVCHGWEIAKDLILKYMKGGIQRES